MKYPYYPGCTLLEKAREFNNSAIRVSKILDIELLEMESWQCCGAVYPLATDNLFPLTAPVRNLVRASEMGDKMITTCAACYNVHKRVNHLVNTDGEILHRINQYNQEDPYNGSVEVLHLIELYRDRIALLEKKVTRDLSQINAAAYYGCLLLRPSEVLCLDEPEDPNIFEKVLETMGCEVIRFPYRVECCGAFATVRLKDPPLAPIRRIFESAIDYGVEYLVVSCPLCHFNLLEGQEKLQLTDPSFKKLQVLYFTELMEFGLGLTDEITVGVD